MWHALRTELAYFRSFLLGALGIAMIVSVIISIVFSLIDLPLDTAVVRPRKRLPQEALVLVSGGEHSVVAKLLIVCVVPVPRSIENEIADKYHLSRSNGYGGLLD